MEKNQRPPKYSHVGKSNPEKEAYSRLLNMSSRFDFDKTFKDEDDITNTDISKVELEEDKKKTKSRPKSIKYKVGDSFKKNLAIAILSGFILIVVGIVIANNRELGEIKSDLKFLSRDIQNIQGKYEKNTNVSNELELLKVEVIKDLESLKERVGRIEERL